MGLYIDLLVRSESAEYRLNERKLLVGLDLDLYVQCSRILIAESGGVDQIAVRGGIPNVDIANVVAGKISNCVVEIVAEILLVYKIGGIFLLLPSMEELPSG